MNPLHLYYLGKWLDGCTTHYHGNRTMSDQRGEKREGVGKRGHVSSAGGMMNLTQESHKNKTVETIIYMPKTYKEERERKRDKNVNNAQTKHYGTKNLKNATELVPCEHVQPDTGPALQSGLYTQ